MHEADYVLEEGGPFFEDHGTGEQSADGSEPINRWWVGGNGILKFSKSEVPELNLFLGRKILNFSTDLLIEELSADEVKHFVWLIFY